MAQSGLSLPPIGFGAFKIGRNRKIKYPQDYPLPDEAAVERLLNGVLDVGIRYIDTAPAYGSSEERIGQSIGHRNSEFVVSTKVGEVFENGESRYDFSERATRESVHRSLRRLRRDVLDLVFVHASRNDLEVVDQSDVVPTLHAMRDEGLIAHLGFSGYTETAFRSALSWAEAIMVEYHLEDRLLEGVIGEAAARGTLVVVKKGLASGRLDPQEAIPFVLSNRAVTSLVVGGLDLEHLRENVRLAERVRGKRAASGTTVF
jgi:aryl-alcohol dehydrogenase-like predicted oxidoreductase